MIFLSYLSGSHFIMKVLLVGIIIFLSFRYLKISKYAFISSIFLFLGTFYHFGLHNILMSECGLNGLRSL